MHERNPGPHRVLVIAEDLIPGGATTVLRRVLAFFRSRDYDVTCITGDEVRAADAADGIIHDADAAKGGWGIRGRVKEVPRARRLVRRYRPDMVVINATSPGYMYAFMFMTLPVCYHLHTAIEAGGDVLRHAVYPRLRGKNKHIAVVSRWQRENVHQRWGIPADVISLLPNYPDRMVRMCSRRDIILTAGRFHWSKNPRTWMQAGLMMQDMLERHGMEMLWCTPFLDDEGRAMVQDLPPRLRVAVITEQSELDGYFSRAAVYYQPSVVEMQGIAVLEAMQNGIPSVVTADTGMTDAVVDGETGIVVPQGDVAAHVAALQLLLDTPALAEHYGHAARALVAERYTARRWSDTLHELMNSISVFDGESR